MLKALIVDDEPLARDELGYLLRRTKQVEVVGEADHMEEAVQQVLDLKPDVVFLDIELAGENGLEIARELMEFEDRPQIVFATAYDEYAVKAFELNAIDYILKPFDEERVQRTVEKLNRLKKESPPKHVTERIDRLAINVDDRILLIPVDDMIYIGFEEGKTVIVTRDERYKVNEPLAFFERKLQNSPIKRVHRGFLANMNHIVEIEPWFQSTYNLIMSDGSKVPVSRTYLKELRQLLGF